MNESFPRVAYKKLHRYNTVAVEGCMMGKLFEWFENNHLPIICPPLFDEFVISYQSIGVMNIPVSKLQIALDAGFTKCDEKPEGIGVIHVPFPPSLEPHTWVLVKTSSKLLVRYSPDFTGFHVSQYENEKAIFDLFFDFNDVDAENNTFSLTANVFGGKQSAEETENTQWHMQNTIRAVAAVQSYVMYHHPEEVGEVKRPEPTKQSEAPTKERKQQKESVKPINIYPRRKLIKIDENSEIPTRKYNYHKMVWQVRGHYQRYGKEKKLTYVAPYFCKRSENDNNKQTDPQKYIISQIMEDETYAT